MVFALQGFTKEFIAMEGDGIGVEYLGKKVFWIKKGIFSCLMFREKTTFRI